MGHHHNMRVREITATAAAILFPRAPRGGRDRQAAWASVTSLVALPISQSGLRPIADRLRVMPLVFVGAHCKE
ncbi:hypothetical protein chiPu_0000472 [Chiloscyllium punctatum]|uniref:Uncharacterized protein n=1 Tax=Chiloscyllium punctatum TaxID=137246 RepID=A0A401RVB1_CHIPU|nr:hypothetical protein [Chiloscyllium punctatum]